MSKTLWKPYKFYCPKTREHIVSDVYFANGTCYTNLEQMSWLYNKSEDELNTLMETGFDSKEQKDLHCVGLNKGSYAVPYYDLNVVRYIDRKLSGYNSFRQYEDWAYKVQGGLGIDSMAKKWLLDIFILFAPIIAILGFIMGRQKSIFHIAMCIVAFFTPLLLLLIHDSFYLFIATSIIACIGYTLGVGYEALVASLICFGVLIYCSFAERPWGIFNRKFRKPIQYGYDEFRAQIWTGVKGLE